MRRLHHGSLLRLSACLLLPGAALALDAGTCSEGVDRLVCRAPELEDATTKFTTFVDCDVRDDGSTPQCGVITANKCRNSCTQIAIDDDWEHRDCRNLEISGCPQVFCVDFGCDGATIRDSVVSVTEVSAARVKEFVDSVVNCDYCYDSVFVRSRVYAYVTVFATFRDSIVYSHNSVQSKFFDSSVVCDSCGHNVFERSEVRFINRYSGIPGGTGALSDLVNSKVTCDEPPSDYDVSAPGAERLCGRSLDGCSCCLGPGCDLFDDGAIPLCTEPGFCDKLADSQEDLPPDGEGANSNQTCTDQRTPFCVADEVPFCDDEGVDHLGAFWGDPHIVTLDGLRYECQVAGEHVLLRSTDRSRQIHGLFTSVGNGLTVTAGVAIQSPFFLNGYSLQIMSSNDLSLGGELLGGCSIQYFEDREIFRNGNSRSWEFFYKERGYVNLRNETENNLLFVEFPTLGVELRIRVQKYPRVDTGEEVCYFDTDLFLSCQHNHGFLEGLLGNADGDTNNDWMDPTTGDFVDQPSDPDGLLFRDAYNYCARWCVGEPGDSLFRNLAYWDTVGWRELEKCDVPYEGRRLRAWQENIDPAVVAVCKDEVSCLMDGATFGVAAAEFHVENKARIAQRQKELSGITPAPTAPMEAPTDPPSPTAAPTQAPGKEVLPKEECTAFFLFCFFRWLFDLLFGWL